IDRLDYRLNILVGAVLNMVALWDFRQVFAILDWRRQYGNEVLAAFDVVAEFEVLVSLATLSRNHPKWAFPEIVESTKPIVTVTNLSHPLISFNTAVANDYHMDSHYVALITGSNMAGKSTFLRTVGINAVLAYCGAPVCGEQMRLSVFRLVTYMRIADSLNESTSTFKAELNRIQLVLQAVKTQPDTFFLIDEMLRGTNSKDKYLGSKAIIKQLIADGGVGMVATHDLQLAKLADEYPHVLANFHFDIQVREGEMFFDYKLKPGECTIFNASLLLKNIGIDVME
ncbi:MutS-related protein, partial [Parapedobacter pyrenivorans]|uniref:MutS-related protein n=1 Tax=Parapedobacter pyrenivorans TaxID=1305674 RepID=UPI003DA79A2F